MSQIRIFNLVKYLLWMLQRVIESSLANRMYKKWLIQSPQMNDEKELYGC
jgi:hypothetical protein